jgi:hypothetical protein
MFFQVACGGCLETKTCVDFIIKNFSISVVEPSGQMRYSAVKFPKRDI